VERFKKARKILSNVGYSSHPHWSTLGEIEQIERERGNSFPHIEKLDRNLPAKWVARNRLVAYSYYKLASERDRILRGELTKEELAELDYAVCEVPLLDDDIIITSDPDGGYLVVRLGSSGRLRRAP